MTEKCLLLIQSGQFIGGVINNLFQSFGNVSIIEASPVNSRELIQMLRKYEPDIVVLDDTISAEYLTPLLSYMQNSSDLEVVVVSSNSNAVEVYQKQQVPVMRLEDLYAVL